MDLGHSQPTARFEDERARNAKRLALKRENEQTPGYESSGLDSSLKRHQALIKRMRQSMAAENHSQILKDIETLSLEKYVDEIAGAAAEGIGRCKTEKDIWSAVEITSALHRRFPSTFTPALVNILSSVLAVPSRGSLASLGPEQRDKEDTARIVRQRPVLRLCAELAIVGVIRDSPSRSGAEWMMKAIKEMLSNDPSLSSLPLLTTFLKSFSYPYLGLLPPSSSKPVITESTPETDPEGNGEFPDLIKAEDELVEQDIRDRFKRMCVGYYENVSRKLVMEHTRLQEQDRRNHEAYIRSGEIFEDRQQAYEKMTKGYEKLLASCQTLSEMLYRPMPKLPTASTKTESIQIGVNDGSRLLGDDNDDLHTAGGKWEDEEERRFYEDIQDLKDFVPWSVLGIEKEAESVTETEESLQSKADKEKEEVRKLEEELQKLADTNEVPGQEANGAVLNEDSDDDMPTPMAGTPKASPPRTPSLAPQGPSQLLTALLTRLPDTTNRALIDQAAVDFAFLNSKAARKRLVKFLGQVAKNRIDLLPHYSRLVATLNPYMPDVGTDLVAVLDEEFRYLQRKKNVVKELSEVRLKNIMFLSNLTKFKVVPSHLILHIFKVCLDDFSGTNVDNIALLLEGCGRFLLRSEDTRERFGTMLELMRRKQSMQHFDQRQVLLLENAYYQVCNPPERAPRQEKHREPMELFIRHLIYDVLAKKTIDKVLKLIRKLDWSDPGVQRVLFKTFTKPWKIKYGSISLLAMLTYDLQRYHPAFAVSVVDQVLEDIRLGLENNIYNTNQRRVAAIKYLGELYIYRLLSSGIIFDTFWSLVTFGYPDGRPLPQTGCSTDMPDDFFRIRLVCVLLDTCGMCFDRGTQRKKLDNFLVYFQYYIHCKDPLPMDVEFMLSDSIEAVRPKLDLAKTLEQAAVAVDDMLNSTFQNTEGDDESGDDSGDENERAESQERDDEQDETDMDSTSHDRAPSPEEEVVLSGNQTKHEELGPSEEAKAEFEKELAKMVTDTSAESRKVDKKTALALWDSAALAPSLRKKRVGDDMDQGSPSAGNEVMSFTLVSKRGNKQQARQLAIPSSSALAVHTRTAQLKDKVEQQELKRLVLNYEQREEAEELKALEARNRNGAIKIRYAG